MATSTLAIELVPFAPAHARALLHECEADEWDSARVEQFALYVGPQAYTAFHEGVPIACGGVVPLWQGVGEAWMLLSRHRARVCAVSLVRTIRRTLARDIAPRYRMIHATTFTPIGRRFLEHLGFMAVAVIPDMGPHGEPLFFYVRRT